MKKPRPGSVLKYSFQDLPKTLHARFHKKRYAPRMYVSIPENYSSSEEYTCAVFLGGGTGFANEGAARRISGGRDMIGVSLPLFKRDLDPEEIHGGIYIQAYDDYPVISRCYRTMLKKLFSEIPNIRKGEGAIGGFSNGGHTTALLLSAVDPFIIKNFRSFFLVDGGFRVSSLHKTAVKKKRILTMIGGRRKKKWRRKWIEMHDMIWGHASHDPGMDVTCIKMKNTEHAFPREYNQTVKNWILEGSESQVASDKGRKS